MVWTFVASVIQSYSNPLQFDKLRNQGMVWTFVVSLASSWIKVVVQSPVELHRVVIHQPYNPLSSEWCKKLRGTCHKFFPFFLSSKKRRACLFQLQSCSVQALSQESMINHLRAENEEMLHQNTRVWLEAWKSWDCDLAFPSSPNALVTTGALLEVSALSRRRNISAKPRRGAPRNATFGVALI